jgi:hypothetical protein
VAKRQLTTQIVNVYEESYDVYVGSPSDGTNPRDIQPGEYGFLGNPFEDMADRKESIDTYCRYFAQRLAEDRRFRFAVLAIRGKRLGCFCEEGEVCHADIIASWLEKQGNAYRNLIGAQAESR